MERRKKIIQYLVAMLTALASFVGGLLSAPTAAAPSASSPAGTGAVPAGGPGGPGSSGGPDAGSGDPREQGAEIFRGYGFDTCRTPSLGTMNAWRKSHYRAVGVYFGGRGRACKRQPNLNRRWTLAVHRAGWRLLPLYVGSQSPCVHSDNKKHTPIGDEPWREGTAEGRDAVRRAAALGMAERSPLYLDMEAYDHDDTRCADTTLRFVRAWSREVRRRGYLPGFYSSAGAGVAHMERARREGVRDLPEVMWFARWGVEPAVDDEPVLDRDAWQPHRRIHQYAGDVTERHGGVPMQIDRNAVDAPVAVVG
ncbi:DUF1906 domain-containing protein [Streptomyces xinghaiensis]|uniref:DUF1906 domain-containing protein n=1 Tax=Streptomyces xinghaiensis TaxID=1038928 RepID=UPI00343EF770